MWSNLVQKFFLIWLNPRIFMPRQNRVSNGSRPHMGNLGRVKAVTSNREQTLRLSQSGLIVFQYVAKNLLFSFWFGETLSPNVEWMISPFIKYTSH